jgi:hypothetical protein
VGGEAGMQAALTGIQMGSQLLGGMAGNSAGKAQQGLYDSQASMQEQEGALYAQEAVDAAHRKVIDVRNFQAEQSHRYASSGITLQGTPLLMLEETRRRGQEEVDAILRRGKAQQHLLNLTAANSRFTGANAASAGRNSMVGSLFQSAGTGMEAYISGKRMGLWGQGSSSGGGGYRSPLDQTAGTRGRSSYG